MPNHVYTKVQVNGTEEEVQNFFTKHFVEDDRGNTTFDFNTFVAMPEELAGTISPRDKENPDLIEKYGADNWYDWNISNWGTKWNSYDNDVNVEDESFCFQTAWSLPDPIFAMMAELYPTMTFDIECVEEGGFFAGEVTIADGVVNENLTSDSEEWKTFANEMLGWEFDEDED